MVLAEKCADFLCIKLGHFQASLEGDQHAGVIGMLITYFKDPRTLARYRSGLANIYLEDFIT